ncbi:MAG: hypothetical protein V1494_08230 [Candidatus Diapherotrites archaeon]
MVKIQLPSRGKRRLAEQLVRIDPENLTDKERWILQGAISDAFPHRKRTPERAIKRKKRNLL